jgi:hypothetical protein
MKDKNRTIKFISSLLLILIIVPAVLFSNPKQAKAFPVWDWITEAFTGEDTAANNLSAGTNTLNTGLHLKDFAKDVLKEVIITIEHKLLATLTQSTVNWINSGFHGSPLFVQNPTSFFGDIAKSEIKNTIDMVGYDSNMPFGKQYALNLISAYRQTSQNNMQYSLSKVISDPVLLNNYRTNFNYGGWNAFLINTQYPQNNYIGSKMQMDNLLASKLAGNTSTTNTIQKAQSALAQGNGFLSPTKCPSNIANSATYNANMTNEFNPPTFKVDYSKLPDIPDCISNTTWSSDSSGNLASTDTAGCTNQDDIDKAIVAYNKAYDAQQVAFNKTTGCVDANGKSALVATTPGSVVADHIMSSLDSSGRLGELDAALGNSISSILDALMNHFLQEGLSGLTSAVESVPSIDNWSYGGQTLSGTTTTASSLVVPTSVSVKTNNSTSTTITGGIAPYSVKTQPDTTIATAKISGTSLSVTGVTAGQTSIVVQDSSSSVQTATIQITVSKTGSLTIDFNNPSALKNISASVEGTQLTMSGGIQPYSITTAPDSGIALALVSDNTLSIVGIDAGTTSLTLQDSSTTPITITLRITIGTETDMSVTPTSVSININANTNTSTSVTVSGGTTPYTIVTKPDSSIVSATISGSTLTIFGKTAGTTSVTIQDSFSPTETITIPITVTGSTTSTGSTITITQ